MVIIDLKDGKYHCSFYGRLDTEDCSKWENSLYGQVLPAKCPIVFDVQNVAYVGSIFLRICIHVLNEAGSEQFSIINASPFVKQVFQIAGFNKHASIT